jgi:spermidine synthase
MSVGRPKTVSAFFAFFFLSGFCSLVYQVVWLRVAMASFGVTTPLISIVLSVFMAGLAVGSWAGGQLARRLEKRHAGFFLRLYAGAEFTIGISGLVVVGLLRYGRTVLLSSWDSTGYYLASACWIALVLLPFTTAMGATFPLAMAGIRAAGPEESPRSFSFLYVANVLGAMAGTLMSALVFIEWLGFSRTVQVAAVLNVIVAGGALAVASRLPQAQTPQAPSPTKKYVVADAVTLPLLFTSGLTSLAMEVVWTRQFVPFLGPMVYSFAIMLAAYLGATALGSRRYRRMRGAKIDPANVATLAGCCALIPLVAADARLSAVQLILGALRVALGVGAFCGVLGFLTPMLVDRWSEGDPDRAGTAYAVNAVGCIVGPLLSGFILLPRLGEHWTLIVLAAPFFLFGLRGNRRILAAALAASVAIAALTKDFESYFPNALVRRDHTATVIATGEGMQKQLLINGTGITKLTPITKMMAHFSMASLPQMPQKILVICFGMGTSYRSALAWGADVTAVDLVPSVPSMMSYFHADGAELLRLPRSHVVIDDGRRFLERTPDLFDVILIDPPPPVAAAGSSMLYSTEFYRAAIRRLRPGGIVQQWIPPADPTVMSSVAQALRRSFTDVRAFQSVWQWGYHFLAGTSKLDRYTAVQMASLVPEAAIQDMLEWGPAKTAAAQFKIMLDQEVALQHFIDDDPSAPILTDDQPVNEYYFLRHMRGKAVVAVALPVSNHR